MSKIDERIYVDISHSMLNKIRELIDRHGYKDLEHLGRYLFQKWYEEHRENK